MHGDFLQGNDPTDIAKAGELLRAGQTVALPTETVYGLAANALDENAVRHIFEVKARPLIDPLIVHVADWAAVEAIAFTNDRAKQLADAFWPGPLTLILKKRAQVPDLVTAGLPTVAVRMPAHPTMRAVLAASQLPLAAPSANPFGYISPTTARHVRDSLKDAQPWIVDGGPCTHGVESTIIDVSDRAATPCILRHGPITAETIAQVLGLTTDQLTPNAPPPTNRPMPAPGLLKRHYSPHTPVVLLETGHIPDDSPAGKRTAWVMLKRPHALPYRPSNTEIFFLSESGDLSEVAHNIFSMLRALDKRGYDAIFVEMPPPEDVGAAVRDRLKRAAAR